MAAASESAALTASGTFRKGETTGRPGRRPRGCSEDRLHVPHAIADGACLVLDSTLLSVWYSRPPTREV